MTTPSIGGVSAFCIEGDLVAAQNKSTRFKVFGRDGNGYVKGSKEVPISKLESTHFVNGRSAADTLQKSMAALVGTVVTITRDTATSPVTVANCYIDSVDLLESTAVVGIPSCDRKLKFSVGVVTPVDW
jgi:hypothetical protein